MTPVVPPPDMPMIPPPMPEIPVIPENQGTFGYLMTHEPAVLWAIIIGVVASAISLAIAAGANVSSEVQNAIYAFIAALWPILALVATMTRRKVYSPATVARIAEGVAE